MSATNKKLIGKLALLKESVPIFKNLLNDILKADNGNLFPVDLYLTAIAHRVLCLISGFCLMIENENFICAAPLVRLQLDNLLRLSAVWLVREPHDFCTQVLKGEQVRKIKDRNNEQMNDSYLVKQLSSKYPWVVRLYKETSGYVHFSNKHHANTVSRVLIDERSIELGIGVEDINVPPEVKEEAADAMNAISNAILEYFNGWKYTKNNPEEIQRMREMANK